MKRIRYAMKKLLGLCLAILFAVGMTPVISQAASNPDNYTFDISEGNIRIYDGTAEGTIMVRYGNDLTADNIPATESITIIQSGDEATGNNIVIYTSCSITLVDVNLDLSSQRNTHAFDSRRNLTIELEGTNRLVGNFYGAGIFNVGTLIINDMDNDGSLYATGGDCAAGIQGSNITINGGTIVATGGASSAGIGGGFAENGENITINGGNVTANGGKGGAGIGGGADDVANNIIITGGIVVATGGDGAAGIGGGGSGLNGIGDATNITISGGNVTATGGSSYTTYSSYSSINVGPGAGIGGGGGSLYDSSMGESSNRNSGKGTEIQITGNATVTAIAGENTFAGGVAAQNIGAGGITGESIQVGESSYSTTGLTGSINGISLPVITTNSLIDGFVGITYYSQKIEVSNTDSDTVFSISEGQLPTGLIIDSQTGVISGTLPDTTGTYTFKVKVANSIGSAEKEYSITVCDSVSNPEKSPTEASNTITGITAGQKYISGDTITFTAVGGADTKTPILGEARWLPVSWRVNSDGDFTTGYTQSFSSADMPAGEHTLTVTFIMQTFDGTNWNDTAVTANQSVSFVIEAASTTESTTESTAESTTESTTSSTEGLTTVDPNTPDTGDSTSVVVLLIMLLSATGIMMNVKGFIKKS